MEAMNGGEGRNSYARNSLLQMKAITKAKPIVVQALAEAYSSILPTCVGVADLGCSSGPNALLVASEVMEAIEETSRRLGRTPPEIQYFLNDLPANDFNTLFGSLARFKAELMGARGAPATMPAVFFSGVPGSFYGRLFPKESIHFVHSSYCLHYLSQVPRGVQNEVGMQLNKQNAYLSETSPPCAFHTYLEQFKRDFTLFLKLRHEEIVNGGRMILVLVGRGTNDRRNCGQSYLLKLVAGALTSMASEGLIKEEKLVDSFKLPLYNPSLEELTSLVNQEGSFEITQDGTFELNWDPTDDDIDASVSANPYTGENVARSLRAVLEPFLVKHFGGKMIEEFFRRFAQNVSVHLSKQKSKYVNLVVSLKKKQKAAAPHKKP